MKPARLCAIAITLAWPGLAAAFTSSNLMQVNPLPGGDFEVVARGRATHGDYWCAAGEYVLHTVSRTGTRRIYISRGLGRSDTTGRRSAVQFSLKAPAQPEGSDSYSLSIRRIGENLSVAAANAYCHSLILKDF